MGPIAAMNPTVASGLITAGGSLFSGLLGGLFSSSSAKSAAKAQLQATRETNAQNYKIWQEQRQHAIDMWNMENDYNSPINQRARLESAGYNPYLAFGDVGNTAGSVNIPSAPQMIAPDSSAFPNTGEIWNQALQSSFINAVNALSAVSQIENTNADTIGKSIDNEYFRKTFLDRVGKTKEEYAFQRWLNQHQEFDLGLKKETKGLQIDILKQQRDNLRVQRELMNLDVKSKEILNNYLDQKQQLEVMTMSQNYYNMYRDGLIKEEQLETQIAQTLYVKANTNLAHAQAALVNSQKQGQDIQNDINSSTRDAQVEIAFNNADMSNTNAQIQRIELRKCRETAKGIIRAMNAQHRYEEYHYNREKSFEEFEGNQVGYNSIRSGIGLVHSILGF